MRNVCWKALYSGRFECNFNFNLLFFLCPHVVVVVFRIVSLWLFHKIKKMKFRLIVIFCLSCTFLYYTMYYLYLSSYILTYCRHLRYFYTMIGATFIRPSRLNYWFYGLSTDRLFLFLTAFLSYLWHTPRVFYWPYSDFDPPVLSHSITVPTIFTDTGRSFDLF